MNAVRIARALAAVAAAWKGHWRCFREGPDDVAVLLGVDREDALAELWGYPVTSLLGAGLMIAELLTTFVTREFRMTLLCGVPFLVALTLAYWFWYRGRAQDAAAEAVQVPGH